MECCGALSTSHRICAALWQNHGVCAALWQNRGVCAALSKPTPICGLCGLCGFCVTLSRLCRDPRVCWCWLNNYLMGSIASTLRVHCMLNKVEFQFNEATNTNMNTWHEWASVYSPLRHKMRMMTISTSRSWNHCIAWYEKDLRYSYSYSVRVEKNAHMSNSKFTHLTPCPTFWRALKWRSCVSSWLAQDRWLSL